MDKSSGSVEEFFKSIDSRTMTEENKQHYKRVVSEMIGSENTHLNGLKILKEVYLQPIVDSGTEHASYAKTIASQIDSIIKVHEKFLGIMRQSEKNAKGDELPFFGKEFVKCLQFLKMASNYITKYPEYLEKLTEILKKEKDIVKKQENAKEEYKKANPNITVIQAISFYLITPVQRIPRYEMLIRDMLKDVGSDFPDLADLKKAYLDAKTSAAASNTLKAQFEEIEKVKFINGLIDIDIGLTSSRTFICCGPMYLVKNLVSKPTERIYFFLFSDRLIGTSLKRFKGKDIKDEKQMLEAFNKLVKINNIEELADCAFSKELDAPLTDGSGVYVIKSGEFVKHLVHCKINQIPYKFSCDSKKEAAAWNSLLFDQIERINYIQRKRNESIK
ncbi:Rho/RAC guanine nucleotide exchange factor [Entamoeba marina]